MTIAFAWSSVRTVTEQVDTGGTHSDRFIDTVVGCDSLSGGKITISSQQRKKYTKFGDKLVTFAGSMPLIQQVQISSTLGEALDKTRKTKQWLDYHQTILSWADKKDREAGMSGITTMIVDAKTGEITTVLGCGSVLGADVYRISTATEELTDGKCRETTEFRYAAIGVGAPIALGAIDALQYLIPNAPNDVYLRLESLKLCQAILRSASRHNKHCGGVLRAFSSSFEQDLGSCEDDAAVVWDEDFTQQGSL